MSIDHIKKGDSLENKQLIIINSGERDDTTQDTNSFTYTFNKPIKRVSKLDVLYSKIPKAFYNLNNDNAIMSITTETFTSTKTYDLVVDDNEIKNNKILSTNIIDGTVIKSNLLICNNNIDMTKIISKDLFLYICGIFSNDIINFQEFTGNSSNKQLSNTGMNDMFVAKYSIDQEMIMRFKISGSGADNNINIHVSDYILVSGSFTSFILNFFNKSDSIKYNIISDGNVTGFVSKYTLDGEFEWVVKITGINKNKSDIINISDPVNKYIYVSGSFNKDLKFYKKNDNILVDTSILYDGSNEYTDIFIAQYDYDGILKWISIISGGCVVKSIAINSVNNQVILGIEYFQNIYFKKKYITPSNTNLVVGNLLSCLGLQNLAIVEFDIYSNNIYRMRIGGSNFESDIRIDINNNTLAVSGLYNSNPLGIYDKSDKFIKYIDNKNNLNNIFIVTYDLLNNNLYKWSTYIYDTSNIIGYLDISVTNIGEIILLGNYSSLLKFNDINGLQIGYDLKNTITNNYNTFISKYNSDGVFKYRSFIKNTVSGCSTIGTSVDAHSNNIFIIGNFNSLSIDLYNSDNSLNSSLIKQNLSIYNGYIISYINNINNFDIDITTLNKRIISRNLIGTDINYTININAFSQQLGLNKSTLFNAMVFGSPIIWKSLDIGSKNNTLSIEFNIGNKITKIFDKYIITFNITIFGSYRPYNLAFELNRLINNQLTQQTYFKYINKNDVIKYDSYKNIFYLSFPINGTFKIINIPDQYLNGSLGLNLPNTISKHCIIVDSNLSDEPYIEVSDNSKITLKIKDQNIEDRLINAKFQDVFPNISKSSGLLNIKGKYNKKIELLTGNYSDNITKDVNINDTIEFDSPWINVDKNEVIFTEPLEWTDISSNFNNKILTAIVNNGNIYISDSSGESWIIKESVRSWKSIALSQSGIYQTAVAYNDQIYISNDAGNTWNVKESIRNWYDISISRNSNLDDGKHQTAINRGGYIYISHDYGETWFSKCEPRDWISIDINEDGTIQVAAVFNGSIWYSIDSGNNWIEIPQSTNEWKSVYMTNNASIISLITDMDYVYYYKYNNNSIEYVSSKRIAIGAKLCKISIAKNTSSMQTVISNVGSIYITFDSGNTWSSNKTEENWIGISLSDDGSSQTAVVNNGGIYKLNSIASNSWSELIDSNTWLDIAMSSDGVNQIAVQIDGITINEGIGSLWYSNDSGNTWKKYNIQDSDYPTHMYKQTGIAMSADGKYRYYSSGSGIVRSSDGGNTWVFKSLTINGSNVFCIGISVSVDGRYVTVGNINGRIRLSNDFGNTFYIGGPDKTIGSQSVSMNYDGSLQMIVGNLPGGGTTGTIFISNDYWITYTQPNMSNDSWSTGSMSLDGNVLMVCQYVRPVYISYDRGITWKQNSNFSQTEIINKFALSFDGTIIVALRSNKPLFISNDKGLTFYEKEIVREYQSVAMSLTGDQIGVVVSNGCIFESNNYGDNWAVKHRIYNELFDNKWEALAMSRNGKYIVSCSKSNKMHISNDYGKSFIQINGTNQSWTAAAISDDGRKIIGIYTFSSGISSGVQTSWDGGESFYITNPNASGLYNITDIFSMDVAMSGDGSIVIFSGKKYSDSETNIFISENSIQPTLANSYDTSWQYDLSATGITSGMKFPCITMSVDGNIRYAGSAQTPNGPYTRGTLMKWVSSKLSQQIPGLSKYDAWFDTGFNEEVLILSCSDDGSQVTVGVPNNYLKYSDNYGVTFSTYRGPKINANIYSQKLKISGNGLIQSCISNNKIYISYDNWITYKQHGIDRKWRSIAMTFDGQNIIAGVSPGGLYQSFNKGETFGSQTNNRDAYKVSLNSSGDTQILASSGRELYISKTSGNTWISNGYTNTWIDIAISKNYNSAVAVPYYGLLYVNDINNLSWNPGTIITNNAISPSLYSVYSVSYIPIKDITIKSLGCYITKKSDTDTIYIGIYNTLGSKLLNQTIILPNNIGLIESAINPELTLLKGNRYWLSIKSSNCDSKFEFETTSPNINSWVRYYYNTSIIGLPSDIGTTVGNISPLIKLGESNIFTSQTLNMEWTSCAISNNGICRIATVKNGSIYISYGNDINTIWTKTNAINNNWKSCAVNFTGTSYIISAISSNGFIYLSNDLGINWINIFNDNTNRNWKSISSALPNNTNLFVAAVYGGSIYKINLIGSSYNIIAINNNNKMWQCVVSSIDGIYYTAIALNDYIYTSSDSGVTWVSRGIIKNWISVSMNDSGSKQVAVSSDGNIYNSNDYGVLWNNQISMKELKSIALNFSGSTQAIVKNGGQILISNNYGSSWVLKEKSRAWRSIDCDIPGKNMAAVSYDNNYIYSSIDYGSSWIATSAGSANYKFVDVSISYNYDDPIKVIIILAAAENEKLFLKTGDSLTRVGPSLEWTGVAISTYSGNIQYAIARNSNIYKSINSGVDWVILQSSPILPWTSIDTSYIGNYVTAVATNNKIYTSSDFGVTWITRDVARNWNNITISADGMNQLATVNYGNIYASTNYGSNWTPLENNRNWRGVAINDMGTKQIACTGNAVLFHSFNLNERIKLKIETINSNDLIIDKVYAYETLNNNLLPLLNYNLATATNFTTTRITNINARDIFIPSGNYTPETLVDTINNLIYKIDSTWEKPKKYGFTYDSVTKKISFVSKISGNDVIIYTNLLKQMGFNDMNDVVVADKIITSSNIVNKDISGPSNIFIKSNVIGELRKNKTAFSTNKKIENIISPLVFNELTNNYEIPFPIEIFLNKKATLDYIDIQIVDEYGRIVNLNGNDVQVNFYLYLS